MGPKHSLGRRTKGRDVIRKDLTYVSEEICPLRQNVIAVAIGQPVVARRWTVDDFLKAKNIRRLFGHIRQQVLA